MKNSLEPSIVLTHKANCFWQGKFENNEKVIVPTIFSNWSVAVLMDRCERSSSLNSSSTGLATLTFETFISSLWKNKRTAIHISCSRAI